MTVPNGAQILHLNSRALGKIIIRTRIRSHVRRAKRKGQDTQAGQRRRQVKNITRLLTTTNLRINLNNGSLVRYTFKPSITNTKMLSANLTNGNGTAKGQRTSTTRLNGIYTLTTGRRIRKLITLNSANTLNINSGAMGPLTVTRSASPSVRLHTQPY